MLQQAKTLKLGGLALLALAAVVGATFANLSLLDHRNDPAGRLNPRAVLITTPTAQGASSHARRRPAPTRPAPTPPSRARSTLPTRPQAPAPSSPTWRPPAAPAGRDDPATDPIDGFDD